MSVCLWCDTCDTPYPDSDLDAQTLQVPIAKIVDGIKVGVSHTVERHQCGRCTREQRAAVERRRAIERSPEQGAAG